MLNKPSPLQRKIRQVAGSASFPEIIDFLQTIIEDVADIRSEFVKETDPRRAVIGVLQNNIDNLNRTRKNELGELEEPDDEI